MVRRSPTRWPGRYADSSVVLRPAYEDEALAALLRGEVDFAIVTDEALRGPQGKGVFETVPLGTMTMQLAAGRSHPLAAKARGGAARAGLARVLAHDFACPTRSMLCGQARGARSDGWRDDRLPRRIRYWVDDLQVLVSLVQSGQALAYLPEFALHECGLVRVDIVDSPFKCTETAHLAWRPAAAAGWRGRRWWRHCVAETGAARRLSRAHAACAAPSTDATAAHRSR